MRVTFIDSKGVSRCTDADPGVSVMQVALAQGIAEVRSDCGGVCTCAACHVWVDPAWAGRFAPAGKVETALLALLEDRRETSRLSCQLPLAEGMDGLVIHTLSQEI